ncbi:hypothetical protein JKA74_11245 [Marivirga sp. S37H4]|uniref:DUF1735 domain-containing protein n=1 Tax=Marivirga aurantiaca TaxID=2802615 RepID=A0A935C8S8_9BACT|nr:hypothetical protein [Marivirga aurantiaca]MBK6265614.1 hypothetical protein [Marivirga aurantiaca]
MENLKKFLVYSLSIVALFSLTAISCNDTDSLLDVSVDSTISESFHVATNDAGDTLIVQTIDPSEDLSDYEDRIKSFSAEKVTITVTDNLSNGNTASLTLNMSDFEAATGPTIYEVGNLLQLTEETEIDVPSSALLEIVNYLETMEKFDLKADVTTDGPVDLTMKFTIYGVVTASAGS